MHLQNKNTEKKGENVIRERTTGPPHVCEQGEDDPNVQQIAAEVSCGLISRSSRTPEAHKFYITRNVPMLHLMLSP